NMMLRVYLAVGTMIGFLSHLVLDELCAVDFSGVTVKLNQFAGSALKLKSESWAVTLATYSLLGGLGWLAYQDVGQNPAFERQMHDTLLSVRSSFNRVQR